MRRAHFKHLSLALLALAGVIIVSLCAATLIDGQARAARIQDRHSVPAAPRRDRAGVQIVVHVVQTDASLFQWMHVLPDVRMTPGAPHGLATVTIDDAVRDQRVLGFGAMLSDSSAWLIHARLGRTARRALMRALFSPSGIALSYLRLPMGASGFTATGKPYSYDDVPAGRSDPRLRHFSIAHDLRYIIPTLRAALAINPHIFLIANPWSPPGWMKANHRSDNYGNAGRLLPNAYAPLAAYFVKFIEAYRQHGVAIDAVTPQNEPDVAADPGLQLSESEEAAFIARYLRPALASARLTTGIYGLDMSWDMSSFARALTRGAAGRDLRGMAWHCYYGNPDVMAHLHVIAPALSQLLNECSPEIRPFAMPELLIASLRNWASAVALHNLALDPAGRPVEEPDNRCRGCKGVVTIDALRHRAKLGLRYYQLGQVSRFVLPGATRVGSNAFVSDETDLVHYFFYATPGLDDVAFINPNGDHVLVTYNNSPRPLSFAVQWRGRVMVYRQPARAMTTFTWH